MSKEDYVRKDLAGRWFNAKYPPDNKVYSDRYHGYRNDVEETLFYDFAVQGYDLAFTYNGKRYYFLSEPDHVALSDENFTEEYRRFTDGNAALEQFEIDGKPIVKLIDKLEDVEPY